MTPKNRTFEKLSYVLLENQNLMLDILTKEIKVKFVNEKSGKNVFC